MTIKGRLKQLEAITSPGQAVIVRRMYLGESADDAKARHFPDGGPNGALLVIIRRLVHEGAMP